MIKALAKRIDTRWLKIAGFIWAWALPAAILSAVIFKLVSTPVQLKLLSNTAVSDWSWIVIAVLLLPFNVGLEAYKWQVIVSPVDIKSIWSNVKIILRGRSLNVISPLGLGDFFAKYMGTTMAQRMQTFGGVMIDRFSQLLPTLIFGAVSTLYLVDNGLSVQLKPLLIVTCLAGLLAVIAIAVIRYCKPLVREYMLLVNSIDLTSLLKIFGASFLRYGVFALQFLCAFWWLGSQLPIHLLFLGISWIFLVKTLIPSLSVLGDLVKRELSAVLFFGYFTDDLGVVILSGFIVWIINIVIPALTGIIYISEMKEKF